MLVLLPGNIESITEEIQSVYETVRATQPFRDCGLRSGAKPC